jgi:signal peptidase I
VAKGASKKVAQGNERPSGPPRKSTAREYFESIVVAVILALFVRTWVFQAFKIPTGSMENNLLVGDHLLVNKFVFSPTASPVERALLPIRDVRRGDIVVFKFPEDPERDFIKRVVGLPGETLELKQKVVHIGGRPIQEPYVHFLRPAAAAGESTAYDVRENYGPVTVPEGHVFVMGDNRDNSQDSRYWGFLPLDYIKGRALVIYWSFDGGADRSSSVFSIVTNLFSQTRWSRLLRPIR